MSEQTNYTNCTNYVDTRIRGGLLFFAMIKCCTFAMYIFLAIALLFLAYVDGITADTVVSLLCCAILACCESIVFFAMKDRKIGRKLFTTGNSFADFVLLAQIASMLPCVLLAISCNWGIFFLASNILCLVIWRIYFSHTRRVAAYFC